jgi:pilus assembly protein CpaE
MAEAALAVSNPALRCEVVATAADRETQEFLQSYLGDAVGGGVHVSKGGVSGAIAYLERAETPPRLLIVDLSGAETPLSEIDRLAEVCEPNVVVVALGETENVHLFRELIRAGIADYVTKPLSPDLLEPYVRERRGGIAAQQAGARRGRLVAVTGGRGGVGVTTLAVATAWRLANVQKRRVALVDLDLHGGAACVQLGLQAGGLLDALDHFAKIDSLYLDRTLIRHGPRLSVMAEEAPLRRDTPLNPAALDALFDALAEDFHYVVVDLPRIFGAAHAHVFRRARTRVVVVDRTLPSLRDGARLIDLGRDAAGGMVVALNDHHPGLKGIVADETVEKALTRRPDLTIAYDRTAAQRGDNLGEPLGDKGGALAAAADRLVAAITGRRGASAASRRGLFGLFGGAR